MDASLFSWTGFAITAAVAVVILVLAFLLVRAVSRVIARRRSRGQGRVPSAPRRPSGS
ncbi:hypothetical protein [Microbacterium sp. HSID17254]|uniref:hypothetical protein n=1 Tax=Microbacterium sp. HSID17254 TaxID=2419509 RepID=UPI001293EA64|nr:hypothetical protein [Microbacterium sp. HSID17254]